MLPPALEDQYRHHLGRLQRTRTIEGVPATDELRERYDSRVWEYLVWLGEGTAPTGPFEAHGRAAWVVIERTLRAYGDHLRRHCDVDQAPVTAALATLRDFHRRGRHGGNHLAPGHKHRAWTPDYDRVREFPSDPERRDKWQRERTRRAASLALHERGELSKEEAHYLDVMLNLTNETCKITYHSLTAIGIAAGGAAAKTAGYWLGRLRTLGWVQARHRWKPVRSRIEATTNEWRIDIPEHLRAEVLEREAEKRARTREENRSKKPGRYTPKATSGPEVDEELLAPSPWSTPGEEVAALADRAREKQEAADRAAEQDQAIDDEDARYRAGREQQRQRAADQPAADRVENAARLAAEIRAATPNLGLRRAPERAPP